MNYHIRRVKESELVNRIIQAYDEGEGDETLEPIVLVDSEGIPVGRIKKGDTVIFYNIRGEREVELTRAFTDDDFSEFPTEDLDLHFITMIEYDKDLNVKVAFPKEGALRDTLSETLSKAGKKLVKIVESEKAIHVRFFLNGKNKIAFAGEEQIVIPTPSVGSNYNENPEMAARQVADTTIERLLGKSHDVIITNLANVDVVGHIEDREAIIKAIEIVDYEVGRICQAALKNNVTVILTSDHGTVERWYYQDGKIDTGHTTSQVPFILIDDAMKMGGLVLKEMGELADVAPTLLDLMGVKKPPCMTGHSLIRTKRGQGSRRERVLLLILDGWGLGSGGSDDLIAQANTPNMDSLQSRFPATSLHASGVFVGLPEGTVGNSEAGHLHIGAGRRVNSDRVKIDNSIDSGDFFKNEALNRGIESAILDGKSVHLLGIVSFFSSHGSLKHLYALMELCGRHEVKDLYIHGMLGRRGERPEAGARYIEDVMKKAHDLGCGKVVTVIGRFWSLDREENWDRIEKAYRTLVGF